MTESTSGKLGVNYAATSTVPEFELGTRDVGQDGTEFIYVQANGTIGQYDFVGIDEDFQAAKLTDAMADDGWFIGAAQLAFADNAYGWIAVSGSNIMGKLRSGCALDVSLYTSGTAGALDDTPTGFVKIDGVVAVTASATSAVTAVEIIATSRMRCTTF